MAIAKPQVLVFQEFTLVPTEITDPLRAHISGPNGDLHRNSVAAEKALINVGAYDPTVETCYPWPGKDPGSIVDQTFTKIFIDDALLQYLDDAVGADSVITPVAAFKNRVRSDTLGFITNGDSWPRSAVFLDRDVRVGDHVFVRGTVQAGTFEITTTVSGFDFEMVASIIGEVQLDAANAANQAAAVAINQISGPFNCLDTVADGAAYNGLVDGDITEVYTIEVTKSSSGQDLTEALLRITSASGNDNQEDVVPAAVATPTDIGTRGLTVTFGLTGSSCSSAASAFDVSENDLIQGQKWQVTVSQEFEAVSADSGGDYTGLDDDTYIVEVTRGGFWAQSPQITVTTVKGLDSSGPTVIGDHNLAIAIGSKGVTITFFGTEGQSSESSLSSVSSGFSAPVFRPAGSKAFDPVNGLIKGDKFLITVTAEANGRASTLILNNNLPDDLVVATDLDLQLSIKKDIEVSENKTEAPPAVNWTQELTQACLQAGITAFDSSWTTSGTLVALPVTGGTIFIEYREWVDDLCLAVGEINDVADLDDIPGPLDPDNPLKWGVFKALENSNGTLVKYTAVCDPTVTADWIAVLDTIKGNDTLYNLVPLTFDKLIQDLYIAHADAESSAASGNWKGCFFSFLSRSSKPVVDITTSTDEEVVLATLEDDPNATGEQFTLLSVPAQNGQFNTNLVKGGDIVRYLFTTDGFGNETFTEFIVDSVLSEDSLLLLAPGHTVAISTAQKIEIHHNLTKNEIADEVAAGGQAFSNRRACVVWPDSVGNAGTIFAGYFAAASMAGLVSGVAPHQGLTNVEIAGFDDLSKSDPFFNASQLDTLANGGIWIITTDKNGTVITRHALTSAAGNGNLNDQEEMIRRNVDSMSFLFLNRLAPFIGKTNVTPSNLRRLQQVIEEIIEFLKTNGVTLELGSQLIEGTIAKLVVHPLLKDRIQIDLNLIIPAPLNNIELTLII